MKKLKKLGALSLARILAVIMSLAGLIAGILYSFGGLIYEISIGDLNAGTALAFLALLGMPLLFATIGFIVGIIGAPLYNIFARITGGIDIEFETA